jgi:hypothetical protein
MFSRIIVSTCVLSLCLSFNTPTMAEVGLPITDDYSQSEMQGRTLGRGPWKVAGGVAACTQDDELYKKFKDHGPMMTYSVPFSDASVRYAFKPDSQVKNVVFTINSTDGHVFRIITSATNSRALVFSSDDHKSKPIAMDLPKFKVDQWNDVSVEVRGKKLAIKIGDYSKSFEADELVTAKTNVTVGFSFGSLAVRDFKITP